MPLVIIIALQRDEICESHIRAPSTAADGDDLPFHSVGKWSRVRSSPQTWRRDVQASDLIIAMTLSYVP
ncbi:hypothetical protein Y032_0114g442 [Ancylostoma ceylanicum]|uniref:Uncharacterized protein n=1 Tax=Ancylostoma ceylanicum TaxID=53326 RepID=A0A016TDD9_9BILA|nr:hypothetical protein Y032_0114g442 [Ancylostoma ceylanicum]